MATMDTRLPSSLQIRHRGDDIDYEWCQEEMREYTLSRDSDSPDEIWLLEHAPVFTLGQAADPLHVLAANDVPVIQSDRGGQVTYHGPGQLVVYLLLDIRRHGMNIKQLVCGIEEAVIQLLFEFGVIAARREGAPGVYVDGRKIAALGLRVRKGCSYHGLSLNVDMDLTPFDGINPCGYSGLEVTQLRDLDIDLSIAEVGERLLNCLRQSLGYDEVSRSRDDSHVERADKQRSEYHGA